MAAVHPRRRPARPADSPDALLASFRNMSLRSAATFHNPDKPGVATWDPLEASLKARSTTCPKALEDLLIGAGERRTAELLERVDKAIAANSKLALGAVLSEPEVLPVSAFMLTSHDDDDDDTTGGKTQNQNRRHSHSSDSGIGSSVADSDVDAASAKTTEEPDTSLSPISTASAAQQRALSKYASDQIHKYIVEPILKEPALHDFHPLIQQVPERIGNKDIKTLRELEKTLIFLAPDYSRTPSRYLRFCERTIRVLHTTVTTLHESDQRAPTDRPYTQGYFLDLVEQIRRYAQILAATRERQAQGEATDEMDYTTGETVSLIGGMSHNGRPAELVRTDKDGNTISLATGQPISEDELASASVKRAMPVDLDDDDAQRSMARRKKGAKPEIHECPVENCDKEFKRPCDLTKHIKTHERPWKCPEEGCKYHTHGWPTEKERDRHINDKHSAAPPEYRCLYDPCPYRSKRESNCKQHMEKAHGWEYVRSKSNGKGKATKTGTQRLPRGSVSASPSSAMLTPLTPIAPSPSSWASRESMPPPAGVAGPSNYGTPAFTAPSPDFAGHFNMNFNFNDMASVFPTPANSDDRRASTSGTSSHSGLQLDGSNYDDYSPHPLNFEQDFSFDNFNDFAFPQPSPVSAAGGAPVHSTSMDSGFSSSHAPFTSPGAQLDQTFTTSTDNFDAMNVDQGFGGDFTLFGSGSGNTAPQTTAGADMFPSLPLEGSSWGNLGSQFDFNAPPSMPMGNSALDELFPELKQQK